MCDPASAALVASGGAQYIQGKAQAKGLNKYYGAIADRNNEISRTSAASQYGQILERQRQEKAAAAQSLLQITRESSLVAGSALAAAAEQGGGQGQSFSLLLQDFERQELEAMTSVDRQQQFIDQQTRSSLENVRLGLESSQLSNIPRHEASPNFLNTFLSVGSGIGAIQHQKGKTG